MKNRSPTPLCEASGERVSGIFGEAQPFARQRDDRMTGVQMSMEASVSKLTEGALLKPRLTGESS
jgi:hypothetical protein